MESRYHYTKKYKAKHPEKVYESKRKYYSKTAFAMNHRLRFTDEEIQMIKEELFELSFPYYTGRNRKVRVYVPEHEEAERLPVIYMTDGQNLFEDNNPGQFGCWYTREAVRSERQKSGRAAVIVGIHNDESDLQRTCELTPASIGEIPVPDDAPEEVKKCSDPQVKFLTILLSIR